MRGNIVHYKDIFFRKCMSCFKGAQAFIVLFTMALFILTFSGENVYAEETVCRMNGVSYSTLNDAVTAAKNSETIIQLTSNVKENVIIPSKKNITIDLQGYAIVNQSEDSTEGSTIINRGNLTITDNSDLKNIHYFIYYCDRAWVYITNPSQTQKNSAIDVFDIVPEETISNKNVKGTANGTVVKVYGGVITGGNALQGGGINSKDGKLTITGGAICGNTAGSKGGGVYCESVQITGGIICGNATTDNNTKCYGGGVFVIDATAYCEGGAISYNYSNYNGGGVFLGSEGKIEINGGEISYNSAKEKGGGVYCGTIKNVITLTLKDGKITGNLCLKDSSDRSMGGGIFTEGIIEIKGGEISKNGAYKGGGVCLIGDYSRIEMSGGSISENLACYGGGLYMHNKKSALDIKQSRLTGGKICNNRADIGTNSFGGGVYLECGELLIRGLCEITGNLSTLNGGGIVIDASDKMLERGLATLIIEGGTISENYAVACGGGIYCNYGNKVIMRGGTIKGNASQLAVVDIFDGNFEMTGGKIVYNTITDLKNSTREACVRIVKDNKTTVILGGTAQITGNTKNGAAANLAVWLSSNNHYEPATGVYKLVTSGDSKAKIGVTMLYDESASSDNALGRFLTLDNAEEAGCFVSDDDSYYLIAEEVEGRQVLRAQSKRADDVNKIVGELGPVEFTDEYCKKLSDARAAYKKAITDKICKNQLTFNEKELLDREAVIALRNIDTHVTYDKAEHGLTIDMKAIPSGYVLLYSNEEDGSYTNKPITGCTSGTHNVFVKIYDPSEKELYCKKGTITIDPASFEGMVTSGGYSGVYDGDSHSITVTISDTEMDPKIYYYVNGTEYFNQAPTFTDAGVYKVDFVVNAANYSDYQGSETVVITKADMSSGITADDNQVVYDAKPHGIIVTVSGISTAKVLYSSEENGTYTEEPITVTDVSTKTVYYKVTDPNHDEVKGSRTVTVTSADMSGIDAKGYQGVYDTLSHTISVNAGKVSGSAVTYSLYPDRDFESENPSFKDAGDYTVYYKVTAPNYKESNGSKTVSIAKANIAEIPAEGYNGVYVPGVSRAITVDASVVSGAAVTYSKDNGVTYGQENPSYTDTGDYAVWFKVNAKNYHEYTDKVLISIAKADMTGVKVFDHNGLYDGKSHTITVNAGIPSDPKITYSLSENGKYTTECPSFTDAGKYTVFYKLEKDNYNDFSRSAVVNILKAPMTGISATGFDDYIDYEQHSIEVDKGSFTDAVLTYALSEEGPYSEKNPAFSEVGEYTVYYKLTYANYQDYIGSATIAIKRDYGNLFTFDTKATFPVTLISTRGEAKVEWQDLYTYGEVTELPETVEREGWVFAGWYTNSACTGKNVTEIPSDTQGKKYYYAGFISERDYNELRAGGMEEIYGGELADYVAQYNLKISESNPSKEKEGVITISGRDSGIPEEFVFAFPGGSKALAELEEKLGYPLYRAGVSVKGNTATVAWTYLDGADKYVVYGAKVGETLKKLFTIKTLEKKAGEEDRTFKFTIPDKDAYKIYIYAYRNGKLIKKSNKLVVYAENGKKTNAALVDIEETEIELSLAGSVAYEDIAAAAEGKKNTEKTTGAEEEKSEAKSEASVKVRVEADNKKKKLHNTASNPQITYYSTNEKVAKVSVNGTITAVGKGECYIYAVALDGACDMVKVTVK